MDKCKTFVDLCMDLRRVIKTKLHNAVSLKGLAAITEIPEERMRMIGRGAVPTKEEKSSIRLAFLVMREEVGVYFTDLIKK